VQGLPWSSNYFSGLLMAICPSVFMSLCKAKKKGEAIRKK